MKKIKVSVKAEHSSPLGKAEERRVRKQTIKERTTHGFRGRDSRELKAAEDQNTPNY